MAIEYLSSFTESNALQTTSMSVTVPATADFAVVVWNGSINSSGTVNKLNFTDAAATNHFTFVDSFLYAGDPLVSMWYMASNDANWPGAGVKTFYRGHSATIGAGVNIAILFFSGVTNVSPVRDTHVNGFLAQTYSESALTGVQATDMTVGVCYSWETTPVADPTGYGQTAVWEAYGAVYGFGVGVHYELGEDIMRFEGLTSNDAAAVWAAFKAGAAAGVPIPVAMNQYRQRWN